jgi:hypothetical protein
LEQLVYISTAHPDVQDRDIAELVGVARYRNRAEGVSGLLMYNGRNFMQVLEGPPAALDAIFGSILADHRHFGIVVLSREPLHARHFSDWSMGYGREDQIEGVSEEGDFRLDAESLETALPTGLEPELRGRLLRFPRLADDTPRAAPPSGGDAGLSAR